MNPNELHVMLCTQDMSLYCP